MRIFLSYGSEDREVAREVAAALRASGHRVFFDRTALAPGGEFHSEISRQLRISDAIIFLLSPSTLKPGRYPLSEIELAERRWPNPANRVFPVVVQPVDMTLVPGYLRAVTIITPAGPIPASIIQAIQNLQALHSRRLKSRVITAIVIVLFIAAAILVIFDPKPPSSATETRFEPPYLWGLRVDRCTKAGCSPNETFNAAKAFCRQMGFSSALPHPQLQWKDHEPKEDMYKWDGTTFFIQKDGEHKFTTIVCKN